MVRRHSFRPSESSELETRVVLSHASIVRAHAALVSGFTGAAQVAKAPQPTAATLVNTAYASFQSDYTQVRALYYSSFTAPAATAFQNYTTQRVNVLAEQLLSTLLVSATGTQRVRGQMDALPTLISRRVDGNSPTSLLSTLKLSIPPAGLTISAATTLYSLSQDNAIEASRISVINAVNIMKSGAYGNNSHK